MPTRLLPRILCRALVFSSIFSVSYAKDLPGSTLPKSAQQSQDCASPLSISTVQGILTFIKSAKTRSEVINERMSVLVRMEEIAAEEAELSSDPRKHLALREEIRQEAVDKLGAHWFQKARELSRLETVPDGSEALLLAYARFLAADLLRNAFELSLENAQLKKAILNLKNFMLSTALDGIRSFPAEAMDTALANLQGQVDLAESKCLELRIQMDIQKAALADLTHRYPQMIQPVYSIAAAQLPTRP